MFGKKDNTIDINTSHVDGVSETAMPWQQPGTASATHEAFRYNSETGTSIPSVPFPSFDQEQPTEKAHENIFHPVQAVNDILSALRQNNAIIELLLTQMQRERVFNDVPWNIGATVGYAVDFGDYKFIYALSHVSITLISSNGYSISLPASQWMPINLPRGSILTVSGGSDTLPNVVYIRRCDVPLPNFVTGSVSGTVTANAGTNLNTSALALESTQASILVESSDTTVNTADIITLLTHGQATMANSVPVVIASDQSSFPVNAFINNGANNPIPITSAMDNASVPTGAANTVVKNSAGSITTLVVTTAGTGAGNVIGFDNATTNSGTPVVVFPATISVSTQVKVEGWFKNGLTFQNVLNGPVFTVFFS